MLTFELPDGTTETVDPAVVLNAGYAGRNQDEVAHHIAELAELGVPAPSVTPALYPVSPYLAQQTETVHTQHGRTSGEAEWALVVLADDAGDDQVLLTAACDHTDRELETHSVAWSKNAAPDVLGRQASRLSDIADHLDTITLKAWVGDDETLIQDGTLSDLLDPGYWLQVLRDRGLLHRGTVLLSGTITMRPGVDQFATAWKVELADPSTGRSLTCRYRTVAMPEPIG
jgi:hypothetical protein